ncbi:MAG TPA: Dabb family protein [Vicinamibacterales bacterium]|nr:Dabb family protein [Vicinamibacterales bacterium]
MLIHLIAFKYKPDVDDAARARHREALATLGVIDGILELKVGADLLHTSRSYDTGLLVKFRDRAALEAYAKDPRHVPIAQGGVALCEHIVAVDFNA